MFGSQTIVVVGGTAGIGFGIARFAADRGARVIVTGRSGERARLAAEAIGKATSGDAFDMTDPAATQDFFAGVGPIDHLVVTAAAVQGGAFRTGDVAAARASFESKFWGPYHCARAAQVSRSILLCGGTLSRRPFPGTSALAAINGAIESLGRALALELAPVRVNVLAPGFVRGTHAYSGMLDNEREAMFESAAARLPAGLVGDADDIAGLAAALLASPYATGTILDIDGGGLLT